jgi:hypothetical protein
VSSPPPDSQPTRFQNKIKIGPKRNCGTGGSEASRTSRGRGWEHHWYQIQVPDRSAVTSRSWCLFFSGHTQTKDTPVNEKSRLRDYNRTGEGTKNNVLKALKDRVATAILTKMKGRCPIRLILSSSASGLSKQGGGGYNEGVVGGCQWRTPIWGKIVQSVHLYGRRRERESHWRPAAGGGLDIHNCRIDTR